MAGMSKSPAEEESKDSDTLQIPAMQTAAAPQRRILITSDTGLDSRFLRSSSGYLQAVGWWAEVRVLGNDFLYHPFRESNPKISPLSAASRFP